MPADDKARFKISIMAQTAEDANGRAYPNYLIPDPASWEERRAGLKALAARPRSDIGVDPEALPPKAAGFLTLVRGGEPIEIEVSRSLLTQLKSDKKNIRIFAEKEIQQGAPIPTKRVEQKKTGSDD